MMEMLSIRNWMKMEDFVQTDPTKFRDQRVNLNVTFFSGVPEYLLVKKLMGPCKLFGRARATIYTLNFFTFFFKSIKWVS